MKPENRLPLDTETGVRPDSGTRPAQKKAARTRIRILVALDGTPTAETILPAIMPLVRSIPSELLLFQVVGGTDEVAEARAYLDRLKAAMTRHQVRASIEVGPGEPAAEILGRLESERFDFAAMTTHGRRGFERLFMGSVAESVVRRSRVPLIINRPQARIGDWRKILVPLDGSPEAEEILRPVIRLATLSDATVHLVHVAEVLGGAGIGLECGYAAVTAPDLKPYLQKVKERLESEGMKVEVRSMIGSAAGETVHYAADIGAGLIALATHGRSGIRRAIMGSVAEQIFRTSPCPILVQPLANRASNGC